MAEMTLLEASKADVTLALLRNTYADRYFGRYKAAVWKAMRQVGRQAKAAALAGDDLANYTFAWQRLIARAQAPLALMMATHGYILGQREISSSRGLSGRSKARVAESWDTQWGIVETSFPDEQEAFTAHRLRPDVSTYLDQTATSTAKTTRDKVIGIVDEGRVQNWTVAELSRNLDKGIADYGRVSATRTARTATIWSYNEGAMLSYKDAGIQAKEWFVTDDDLLCEFCAPMQGVQTLVDEPFVAGDTRLEVALSHLDIQNDIAHPPLHPSCRCVLLPVIVPWG